MNLIHKSYAYSHLNTGYGQYYNRTYIGGYYGSLWENVEKPLLRSIFEIHCSPTETCLDFACGTGRITAVACDFFKDVDGVDVSADMLSVNPCSENADLHCQDIRNTPLGKTYDVVAAFRFFLNAEHSLRSEALNAIRDHMNDGGRLICNIHMSETSPMGRLYRLLNFVSGGAFHKTLSMSDFARLLQHHGFRIEKIYYYGFMGRPGPLFPSLVSFLVPLVEKAARYMGLPSSLAHSCIIVARRV